MTPPWHLLLLVAVVGAARCPDGTTCGEKTLCCELPGGHGFGCCPEEEVVTRSLPMMTEISCTDQAGCPEEYSCVRTPRGGSACCPTDQGISCQDGHHCCPSGSHCSEDGHHCIPASNLTAVICPDGRSECPNDASCCLMPDQSWGCCPIPQATCCDDHLHCCPHNTVCDVEHAKCVSENGEVPLSKKFPARMKLVGSEKTVRRTNCGDGSSCPDGSTCCEQSDHSFGCCPFLSAICCDDHIHCCPSGTTCDVSHMKCVGQDFVLPLFTKTPTLREKATVQCDETSECPGDTTCCRLASGEWGCCPLLKAVCCPDKIHCCPNGFTCDGGSCQQEHISIPWLKKIPALKQKATVQCDETSECPGDATCCRLASGEWGCCPLVKAVCCPDKIHCCPNGFTCDGGSCQQEHISIPWLKKIPALKRKAANVKCDESFICPDKNTCCQLQSGEWGCCPIEQAVCCSDHLHCCPSGYTCDVASGSCNKPFGETVQPAYKLQPAVCCPDKIHCCPNGFTCDGGSCQQEHISIPWLKKIPALKRKAANIKCDESFICPDKNTCCQLQSGEWGCCPIEQATCCPEQKHGYPRGLTRDEQATYVLGTFSIPRFSKTLVLAQASEVKCDKSHSCAQGTTCCHTEGGGWACCPLEEAVCCSDHLHCCPSGYTCDVASGSCNKPFEETVQPAYKLQPVGYVWCDSTHACYDGQTCCVGPSSMWNCCPYSNGVCCPDRVHCCPYGHVCLFSGAQCSRSGNLRWDHLYGEKKPLL